MARCLIGLGANLGDAEATLRAALAWLAQQPGVEGLFASASYRTIPAGGPRDQPQFANRAARFDTSLSPEDVLDLLQRGEAEFGRERRETWGPRTLDLDLLLYDELQWETPRLTLPHPRMAFRRFVLEPAAEVAGDFHHPTFRSTLAELLSHVNSVPRYVAVAGACWFAKQYVFAQAMESLKQQNAPVRALQLRGMTVFGAPVVEDPEHPFVEHYCELMPRLGDDLRETLSQPQEWLLSSYWQGEIELGAQLWFTGPAREAAQKAYEEAFAGIPPPQLLVYLETPDDLMMFNHAEPGHDAGYYEHARRLAAQRDVLDRHVAAMKGVPQLRLSASKPELAIRELAAAVTALAGK